MALPTDPVVFARLRNDNGCALAVDGRVLRVRNRPTVEWLDALSTQKLHKIVPGMLKNRDAQWLTGLLADPDNTLDTGDLRKMYEAVVLHVTGMPWWAAVRLANSTAIMWTLIDSVALTKNVDLLSIPIRRALAVVYTLALESCKEDKDRAILDNDIFRAPEGVAPSWSPEQQAASFAAFRAVNAQYSRRPATG